MRRIVLQLADDTTDNLCGSCPSRSRRGECDVFGPLHPSDDGDDFRTASCRTSELRQDRVESVEPELVSLALLGLERDERAERIGRAVIESGFNVSDAEAVRTIYSWAGNGASRIVDCMRAIADAMEDSP